MFLGANGVDCRVPEGKALVLSDGFWECSTAEGLGTTFQALRRCAIDNFAKDLGPDALSLTLRIDGERVAHPREWTVLSPGEIITFPDDNLWGAAVGPTSRSRRASSSSSGLSTRAGIRSASTWWVRWSARSTSSGGSGWSTEVAFPSPRRLTPIVARRLSRRRNEGDAGRWVPSDPRESCRAHPSRLAEVALIVRLG